MKIVYENEWFIFDRPKKQNISENIRCLRKKLKAFAYNVILKIIRCKVVKKKYKVAIAGIFKNEAVYLKEWIEFHKLVGVEHFYLYNNNSDDNYLEVIEPYINEGIITLVQWPYNQQQMEAYMHCIKNFSEEVTWIGFIDLDEFVIPVKTNNLYDLLKDYEDKYGSVLVYWKMFGAGRYIDRDLKGLVVEDFYLAAPKHHDIGKCFYNTNFEFDFDSKHNRYLHHMLWTKIKNINIPPVDVFGNVVLQGVTPPPRGEFSVQINHYATKSWSEFKLKKAKGDVYFKVNPHDEEYFYRLNQYCTHCDFKIYKFLVALKSRF